MVDLTVKWIDRIIFVAALVLIVLTVVPYGTVDAWWEAVFECGTFTITALWIVESLLLKNWRISKLWPVLPLVLLVGYAFAQIVSLPVSWLPAVSGSFPRRTLTIDPYQTYLTARKLLALVLFIAILLIHTSTQSRVRWIVRLIVGLGFASAVFGIVRQLSQSPASTSGFVLPFLFPGYGYGEFISSNVFAYLVEMVFALILGVTLCGGSRREWVPINLAIAVVVWTALVLSNSRGGVVGLTCASMFVSFVALSRYSARRLLTEGGSRPVLTFIHSSPVFRVMAIVLLVLTLVAGVVWMGGEKLAAKVRAEATTDEVIDGGTRKDIWRYSWESIKEHPLTGTGFGTYFLAITKHQNGSGRIKLEQAHNDYLDLMANGGIIALGLAAWFIIGLIRRIRSLLGAPDSYRRAAVVGASAGILAISIHSLVDFGLQITGIAIVFCALIVICLADVRVDSIPLRQSLERSRN